MTDIQLFKKLQHLKPPLKDEVNDFVDFLLTKHGKEMKQRKPQFGCAKGRFKMSADFDAPTSSQFLKGYADSDSVYDKN